MEYPFIIGTAGHIDHGKTTLVKALTGVDCDRLEEEKRRGITIELGFAPLTLTDGRTVSIVDVPGHERFIRQMAAGASGMDAALLVIAADDGVMPQTREHLDILSLLGVRFGLVALTKKDTVDTETLALATSEAAGLIQGSCLEGAAIIPVSAPSGDGITLVIQEIEAILKRVPPRASSGAFYLPIDRVFSKKGFGSVVTGAVYQGRLVAGDEIDVLPAGAAGKARSLQTHGMNTSSVSAGQRAAINLSGIDTTFLKRGAALCAKDAFIATDCLGAWLDVLPAAPEGVTHWQRARLHIGTTDTVARVSLLNLEDGRKTGIAPGSGGPVQLLTEAPLSAAAGQRFVIRLYSPLITIGGGRILLPNAALARGKKDRAAKERIIAELAADFAPVPLLAALIRDRGVISAASLFKLSQMEKEIFQKELAILENAPERFNLIPLAKTRAFITEAAFHSLTQTARRVLRQFHAAHPERAGLDAETLTGALETVHKAGAANAIGFKELLALMISRKEIAQTEVQGKIFYHDMEFRPAAGEKFNALVQRVKKEASAAGFNLIKMAELEARTGVGAAELKRAAAYLREQNELWLLEDGLLFPLETRDALRVLLASMREPVTVAALRDAAGVNRKCALAMLDALDTQGITRRDGDIRVLIG